ILLTLGLVDNLWVLFPVLILGGGCWIGALATYNSAVQILVPDWIKARALALYQTALYGGLALGSFLWGHLAETMTVHGAREILAASISGRRELYRRITEASSRQPAASSAP
ncbi:MFS transporter, partial [Pseudomonas aeruginosa]